MPSVADVAIDRLHAAGVRALFGVPGGGGNLDLVDAATRRGVPFVLTATETSAALAAIGQAEVTGRPAACLTTLGPGATSVVNGIACAFLDRAPVVVFTDSHPASAGGRYEHQRIDHGALFAPITCWRGTLEPATAPAVIAEAIARSQSPRPGPVHLDCPGEVASAECSDGSAVGRRPAAEPADANAIAAIERLLRRARRPLLLVGLGARGADDAAAVRAFCDRHRVPALVTYKAKGVVPDNAEAFAGVFTNASLESAAIDQSDLLIGVGLDPVELIPRAWKHAQPIVYCGAWKVEDAHVPFAVQGIGSIAATLKAIGRAVQSDWEDDAGRRVANHQRARLLEGAGRMSPQRVVLVAAERARDARVVVDAGAHMFPATMLWPVHEPDGMLISNGLSTMGFALPAAIGAALADRDRPVIVVTGDGGLLMCAGELLTAAREQLRIATVVFSDDSLSLIEIKQQARRLRPAGVALGGVNWPSLAASLGVASFCASTEVDLARAIDAAQAVDGPSLIEARIDRSAYPAIMRVIRG